MLTKLGQELRNIRVRRNLLLYHMAHDLGLKSSELSAIEHGRKKITKDMVNKIIKKYDLCPMEIAALVDAIEKPKKTEKKKNAIHYISEGVIYSNRYISEGIIYSNGDVEIVSTIVKY